MGMEALAKFMAKTKKGFGKAAQYAKDMPVSRQIAGSAALGGGAGLAAHEAMEDDEDEGLEEAFKKLLRKVMPNG